MELSVVVLSWNTGALLRRCLGALAADRWTGGREVVVVDNGSADGSPELVRREFPGVRLLAQAGNLGYAAGNNAGAAAAAGEWLCLLGSDTEVRPGALAALTGFLAASPGHAAAAPRLVGPGGEVQRSCMRFPGLATALTFDNLFGRIPPGRWVQERYYCRGFDHLSSRDVDQPPGTCLVLARERFLAMGGFDPNLFLFFNDVDLCRRLRLGGGRLRFLAEAEVLHHGGASTRAYPGLAVRWHRDRLAYYRKWYGRWAGPLVKLCVLERALEEWFVLGRRHAGDGEARRAARRDLSAALREVLRS